MIGCDDPEGRAGEALSATFCPERPKADFPVAEQQEEPAKPRRMRCRLLKKDGTTIPVELSSFPIVLRDLPLSLGLVKSLEKENGLEGALRESESRYRALFEGANDAILITRGEVFVACNPKALKMFGCEKEQIIGRTLYRFSAPLQPDGIDSRTGIKARVGAVLSGEPQFFEWRHCRLDGSLFDAEVSLSEMRTDKETLLQAIIRDITDRRRAEEAARESERTYRELADLLPQTVVEFNEKGYLTFVNRSGFEAFGYSMDDLVQGLSVFHAIAQGEHARLKRNMERLLEGEAVGGNEYTMLRKGGSAFPGLVHASPVTREGKPSGFRAIVVDITLRKQVEEALAKSEEALLAMINATREGLFMIDGEGRILVGNGVFAARMDRGLDELRGASLYDLLPFGSKDLFRENIRKVFASGETVMFEDVREERVYQAYAYPVFPLSGPIERVSVFERDITHLKEAERALTESEERYRQTVENFPEAVVLAEAESFFTLNPAALELYGVNRPEGLKGKKILDYIELRNREVVADRIARVTHTAIPLSLREIHLLRVDGEVIPTDLTLGTVNHHGKRMLQVIFRDISQRKKAEEALRESEERYRNIFENAMVGIFRTYREGGHIDMNPALARIHGFESAAEMTAEIKDMSSVLYTNPEDRARYAAGMRSAGFLQDFEVELYRRDRSTVWVSMNVRRVRGAEGRMIYDEGIVDDVTERKRAEEALRKRERDLEIESIRLEEANAALRVLLRHRDEDKTALENAVMDNVRELVLPYIEKLKSLHPGGTQAAYLTILEENLNSVFSPFLQKMNALYARFTPTEVQVANLIKSGKTTKEVAELMNVSAGTVNSHRNSVRNKLGLRNKQINLRTYLMSL
ncbi:MAG TPA: PAS domain S-box protein [Syntrophorhabdaceae bacterium]|jgi:PAS domain S-box-containing protein